MIWLASVTCFAWFSGMSACSSEAAWWWDSRWALMSIPIASMLYGVDRWDSVIYGVIIGTLVLTAVPAALGPALRTIRVDPVAPLQE